MPTVVTIARRLGSGGEEIAYIVAERLGISCLDREIVTKAAAQAGVSEETISSAERVPSFLERMAEVLGRYPTVVEPDVPVAVDLLAVPTFSTEAYRHLIEDVIRSIARTNSAVIIGHAAQIALRDMPSAFRVFVYAPFSVRVARVAEQRGLALAEAQKAVQKDDQQRDSFFRTYYRASWQDPELYDLIINTSRISFLGAAELILAAIEQQAARDR